MSAGRHRSRPEGSEGAGGGGESQSSGLFLDWREGAAVASDAVDHIPCTVVTVDTVSSCTRKRKRDLPNGPAFAHRVGKFSPRPRLSCGDCAGDWW